VIGCAAIAAFILLRWLAHRRARRTGTA